MDITQRRKLADRVQNGVLQDLTVILRATELIELFHERQQWEDIADPLSKIQSTLQSVFTQLRAIEKELLTESEVATKSENP